MILVKVQCPDLNVAQSLSEELRKAKLCFSANSIEKNSIDKNGIGSIVELEFAMRNARYHELKNLILNNFKEITAYTALPVAYNYNLDVPDFNV